MAIALVVPVPPVEIQAAITAYLEQEMSKINKLIVQIETGIENLHDYRTALISSAVTGKIDVRNC